MKLHRFVLVFLFGAALVGPGTSRAVTIVFDVSGASTERNPWIGEPGFPYHETAFSPGSSLTLETDANGDGVSGDYTIVESRFEIHGSHLVEIPGLGETGLTWDIVGELHGGSGVLENDSVYDYIWWPGPASYSVTGTWQCFGVLCGYENLPEGVPMPYAEMLTFMQMEPIEAVSLGSWVTDGLIPTHFEIACGGRGPFDCHTPLDTGIYVTTGVDAYGNTGPMIALLVTGEAVPEPRMALVAAVGLLALALRRWVSGTMRRHEVA